MGVCVCVHSFMPAMGGLVMAGPNGNRVLMDGIYTVVRQRQESRDVQRQLRPGDAQT